jgi:transglutaminase-like putative cysteine protease
MLYDIGVKISYDYDLPVIAGRHVLRLMPAVLAGEQDVLSMRLVIDPACEERVDIVDFFGNAAVEIAYRSPHDKIVFGLRCRVDRHVVPRTTIVSPVLAALEAEIAAELSLGPQSPHHFLGRSPRVRPMPDMNAYTAALLRDGMTAHELVLALGSALHRDMKFDPKATTVDTPPEQAFAGRHGVCQDFAHIMIACLRGAGVPAGYVSGFLRTIPPKGKPRLSGADAMHAWVQAWCGHEAGWVEYDPTNNLLVGDDHIVVARGRDYSDVSPVKGVLRTAGSQVTKQEVDVVPLG